MCDGHMQERPEEDARLIPDWLTESRIKGMEEDTWGTCRKSTPTHAQLVPWSLESACISVYSAHAFPNGGEGHSSGPATHFPSLSKPIRGTQKCGHQSEDALVVSSD